MDYLATFYTHYGAARFLKHCEAEGLAAKMTPAPRVLSASCGVCVRFASDGAPAVESHEDMERCYAVSPDGGYVIS